MSAIVQELQRLGVVTSQLQQSSVPALGGGGLGGIRHAQEHNIGRLMQGHNPPKPFTGERAVSGYNVDYWIGNLERCFRALPAGTLTAEQQVGYAATLLHDAAGQWWDTVASGVHDWPSMKRKLLERYRPIAASQVARSYLDTLVQRGSVDSYTNLFLNTVMRIDGITEDEKVHAYKRGLHSLVRDDVDREYPRTLEAAMLAAQRAEQRRRLRGRGFVSPHGQGNMREPRESRTAVTNQGAVPMELGALSQYHASEEEEVMAMYAEQEAAPSPGTIQLQAQVNSLQQTIAALQQNRGAGSSQRRVRQGGVKMTAVERAELMREGKCFRCKATGHISRDCPESKKH